MEDQKKERSRWGQREHANPSFPSVLSQSYMNFKGNAINIKKCCYSPVIFWPGKKGVILTRVVILNQ